MSSGKPVRECVGCALNLGNRCAVFRHPAVQWRHGKCEGFNNARLISRYEKMLNPEGALARKLQRRERARLAHTVDHRDGVKEPGSYRK